MYSKLKTISAGDFTVTIHKPILTEIERSKREKDAIKALEHFGKALENDKSKQK